MRATISNDIAITGDSLAEMEPVFAYCRHRLDIPNPDYEVAVRLGRDAHRMPRKMSLWYRDGLTAHIPIGMLTEVWDMFIRGRPYFLAFPNKRGNSLDPSRVSLYDYQKKAVQAALDAKNGILIAPCGSGKTTMGLAIAAYADRRTLWITHTHRLLVQALERARELWPEGDFAVCSEGKVAFGRDITFATVQTLSSIDPLTYREAFDAVIVDECHHCVGGPAKVMQFYRVVSSMNCRCKIGLTATLCRADGLIRSALAILGPKFYEITGNEVGDRIVKAEHIEVDYPGSDYPIEDYCGPDGTLIHQRLIQRLSQDDARNAFIMGKVREAKNAGRKKQLILCHRVEQVLWLQKAISQFADSEAVFGRFGDRDFGHEITVATYAIAKEGIDVPELDTLHLATPQVSEGVVRQCAGRVERGVDGKLPPVIYDYVDANIPYCVSAFKKRKKILKRK